MSLTIPILVCFNKPLAQSGAKDGESKEDKDALVLHGFFSFQLSVFIGLTNKHFWMFNLMCDV